MAYLSPSGKRSSSSRILALMRSATSRALDPGSWKIARPTDGLPSSVRLWSWFLAPSSVRPTSLR